MNYLYSLRVKKMQETIKKLGLCYSLYIKNASARQIFHLSKTAVKTLLGRNRYPFSVLLSVTYRCQCDCVHCGIVKYKDESRPELGFEDIKRIIHELGQLGIANVTLTGGEALLRKDIFDIISYISGQGLIVTLDTNGLLLDEQITGRLKSSGLNLLKVSIDSSDPDKHDKLRNVKGCFNKALDGLKNSVKSKLPCVIQTYISYETVQKDELGKIITLAKELNLQGVCAQTAKASGKLENHDFSGREIHDYIKKNTGSRYVYFSNIASDFQKIPGIQKRECYISSYGELRPGMFVSESFGNVIISGFEGIWNKMIENHAHDRIY